MPSYVAVSRRVGVIFIVLCIWTRTCITGLLCSESVLRHKTRLFGDSAVRWERPLPIQVPTELPVVLVSDMYVVFWTSFLGTEPKSILTISDAREFAEISRAEAEISSRYSSTRTSTCNKNTERVTKRPFKKGKFLLHHLSLANFSETLFGQ
jgi:hypothetical protein